MKHFLYATVDIAAPPQWLLAHALELYANDTNKLENKNKWTKKLVERTLIRGDQKEKHAFLNSFILNEDAHRWASKELGDTDNNNLTDIRYAKTKTVGSALGPHRDSVRNFTLIYLLSAGGDDSITTWYKDNRGGPLAISTTSTPKNEDFVLSRCVNDYSLVEKIAETKLEQGQWTIINSAILHSVENIPMGRESIQISLMELPSTLKYIDPVYYNE